MAEHLPLLVFPDARLIKPKKSTGFPQDKPHFPSHARQVERLNGQLEKLQDDFSRYKADISGDMTGLEPEVVLVIEIAGSVDDFRQAVEASGLEWLGEWDLEEIEPDEDFYIETRKIGVDFFKNKIEGITTRKQSKEIREALIESGYIDQNGKIIKDRVSKLRLPDHLSHLTEEIVQAITKPKDKLLSGRLFLSFSNEQGLNELLSLYRRWKDGSELPYGKKKWKEVFKQIRKIRRWGIEETLIETGMIDTWRDLLDPVDPNQEVFCQIELFYRNDIKRRQNEKTVSALISAAGGETLGPFIDMSEIAFHAVKAKFPSSTIRRLLEILQSQTDELDIELFKFPGVMYFRPTGQSLTDSGDETGEITEFPEGSPELPPVVAILDGVPNLQHKALENRLLFDDPDNLSEEYQPGERRHGTAMASLVIHGELVDGRDASLTRQVLHLAVMQPDPAARIFKRYTEYFPEDVFFEDRIHRAVRRIFEGEGNNEPLAPTVRIINLSIGDPERPFIRTPSPWARLLDWLSWKYRVLFCVSAGNFLDGIDLGIASRQLVTFSNEQRIECALKGIKRQLSQRRLLSPAESLNSLTVGALHQDESGDYPPGHRIDLMPESSLFSPISRVGHGFRRSVKPEILFAGGRQLYEPSLNKNHEYGCSHFQIPPGQKVAFDSSQEGERSRYVYSRGTSNATALATRNGARIYEVLEELQIEHGVQIDDSLIAVLIKALLVHGAQHPEQAKNHLSSTFKNSENSRRFKEVVARYMGYGAVDIERVLQCTQQRATVIGSGEIGENEIHEYRFPIPVDLSGKTDWRRMAVTLAWFTPINPAHRNLREAKLELSPVGKWKDLPLKLERQDTDHNQVLRGTVQHEILEGEKQIKQFQDGEHIRLQVTCKSDATERLDTPVPYGLAVTLEVAEGVGIPVYQRVWEKIKPKLAVAATGRV